MQATSVRQNICDKKKTLQILAVDEENIWNKWMKL